MNSVMHGYIDDSVLVYLDDILIFSNTEDEHESHLARYSTNFANINYRLN